MILWFDFAAWQASRSANLLVPIPIYYTPLAVVVFQCVASNDSLGHDNDRVPGKCVEDKAYSKSKVYIVEQSLGRLTQSKCNETFG